MNLHPIFVHFPIALLTSYAILELIRFQKVTNLSYWFYVKASLVIIGTISAYLTLLSGQLIEGAFKQKYGDLVEIHSAWAEIATVIFSAIAVAYGISWFNKQFQYDFYKINLLKSIWHIALKLQYLVLETKLIFLLVLAGLFAITLTGVLGGIIAFGPDVDPLTKFIYKLLIQANVR